MADVFSEAVVKSLESEVSPLNGLAAGDVGALATLVLEQLKDFVDAKGLINAVSKFAKSRSLKKMSVLESGVRGLMVVFQNVANREGSGAEVREALRSAGLEEARAAAVERSWRAFSAKEANPGDLGRETLRQLVDLEWRFGVTCASDASEGNPVGKTFLQLKLVLDRGGRAAYDIVELELTLPQFYDFLAKLEQAKASIDQLTNNKTSSD